MSIFIESKEGDLINTNTIQMVRQYEDGSIHAIVDFSDESIELKSNSIKEAKDALSRHPIRKVLEDAMASYMRHIKSKDK